MTYCWASLWPRGEAAPKAKAAAQRAIQLDPMLADAYVAMGAARTVFDWDWVGGETNLLRALELSPHSSLSLANYAGFLVVRGRFDEAVAMQKRALEFDPLSPGLHSDLGWTYYCASQPARAMPHLRRAQELAPGFFQARLYAGLCYLLTGDPTKALSELKIAEQLDRESIKSQMALGYAYGVTGHSAEARNVLAVLDRLAEKGHVAPSARAVVHAGLGETNVALDWLEKACMERDVNLPWVIAYPCLSPMRNEPRFQALLQKVENGGRAP